MNQQVEISPPFRVRGGWEGLDSPTQLHLYQQFAHDIASPLECIKACYGYLENLPGDIKEIMDSAIQRATEITEQLKRQRQMNRSDPPPLISSQSKQSVNVTEVVRKVILEKKISSTQKGVSIEYFSHCETDCFCLGDGVELARVFSNLLNNAIQAVNAHHEDLFKQVHINITRKENKIHLSLSDSGTGIPPEVLPKLFERGATFGKENGSGLGLYHAKATIEACGGTIKIESEFGTGTTIFIELLTA